MDEQVVDSINSPSGTVGYPASRAKDTEVPSDHCSHGVSAFYVSKSRSIQVSRSASISASVCGIPNVCLIVIKLLIVRDVASALPST